MENNNEIYFDFDFQFTVPMAPNQKLALLKKPKDINFDNVFEMCNNFANLCGYDLKEYKKHE